LDTVNTSTASGSTIGPDQGAGIGCIDTAAHTSTCSDADHIEIGVSQINILIGVEILTGGEVQDQWIGMD
jgi:hypothetical protein